MLSNGKVGKRLLPVPCFGTAKGWQSYRIYSGVADNDVRPFLFGGKKEVGGMDVPYLLMLYSVYRDTYPNPLPDSTNWIADVPYPEASYMDSFVVAKKTYYYWLTATDLQGNISDYSELAWLRVTEVEEPLGQKVTPMDFELSQNWPNPFNATTAIRYTLPQVIGERFKVKGGLTPIT